MVKNHLICAGKYMKGGVKLYKPCRKSLALLISVLSRIGIKATWKIDLFFW